MIVAHCLYQAGHEVLPSEITHRVSELHGAIGLLDSR